MPCFSAFRATAVMLHLQGMYNNVVPCQRVSRPRLAVHVLGRLAVCSLLFAWPFLCFPAWKALVWAVVPITLFSWSFMLNSQVRPAGQALLPHAGGGGGVGLASLSLSLPFNIEPLAACARSTISRN